MNFGKLIIDPRSFGNVLIACGVKPVYSYQNGQRLSDEVIALRYDIVCPEIGFEKIGVKVDISAEKLDVSEDNPIQVELIDLEARPVWTPNGYIISATAKGIKAVDNDD